MLLLLFFVIFCCLSTIIGLIYLEYLYRQRYGIVRFISAQKEEMKEEVEEILRHSRLLQFLVTPLQVILAILDMIADLRHHISACWLLLRDRDLRQRYYRRRKRRKRNR